MRNHAEKRRQLRRFAPGLLLRTFLKLTLVFFAPLALVSMFFLYRQYRALNERLHDSYLTRTGLIALQLENLIKDRAALDEDNPLLLRSGTTRDLAAAFPDRRLPADSAAHAATMLLYSTGPADEKELRILYYFPVGERVRYYLFQAEFVGDFLLQNRVLKPDELFFLLNSDGSPALSNVLVYDLEIPEQWFQRLTENDFDGGTATESDPTRAGAAITGGDLAAAGLALERQVLVDGRSYLLGQFPLPGLPFRAAIARPTDLVLAPLYRELYIQSFFLALVLLASFVFSYLTARDQIRPLRTLQQFLEHVAERDFSFIPRTRAGDERRDIFAAVNLLRRRLRRYDRMNAEELHRRNMELERLNEQKNQLIGTAAHDLRNPLGAIQAFSRFLTEFAAPNMEAGHRRFVDQISSLSRYMLALVNDLLDLSELSSGALHLNREDCDLMEIVAEAVATNRVFAEQKQIEIRTAGDETPLELNIDRNKIEQVLNNLLSNAIKYSHEKTLVRLEIERDPQNVVVAVIDQGQGIQPDELARVFRPFAKTSTRTTAGESSAGLGLAIVRRIVEGHGGRITVESEPGVGSTFRFSLPLRYEAPADADTAETAAHTTT